MQDWGREKDALISPLSPSQRRAAWISACAAAVMCVLVVVVAASSEVVHDGVTLRGERSRAPLEAASKSAQRTLSLRADPVQGSLQKAEKVSNMLEANKRAVKIHKAKAIHGDTHKVRQCEHAISHCGRRVVRLRLARREECVLLQRLTF
eukprot:CAMPEP_0206216624 /NCGR_PEP_ID=MMETSP0047_2-20121206/2819_1 /ASSEMBLY_ACC=CAM_ASM_000192 /TAXON_ID=195065 /ORGANISM="Chroomonas mesostigmatica_cf, Strain CCMP1168" /LENGTH=149 /DNA_ID=CAMNT_0053638981 /DNA_START=32 /DNA_END=481 /DNA_ORIENTATION=+